MSIEIREGNGAPVLTGWASVFDHEYRVGAFTEVVRTGAFRRSLNSKPPPDVQLLLGHGQGGSGLALASTPNSDLHLSEDSRGLRVRAELDPADPDVQAVLPKARKGALAMSFAFTVPSADGQRWSEDFKYRELLHVGLNGGDVSLVARPASDAASATVRSGEMTLEQRKARAESLGRRWTGEVWLRAAGVEVCATCEGRSVVLCPDCGRSHGAARSDDFSVWLRAREAQACYRSGAMPPERDPIARARQRTKELQESWTEHEAHRAEWERP